MRRTSAPSRTASATAAAVPHSRSPAGQRSSQEPARTAPTKSLRESET